MSNRGEKDNQGLKIAGLALQVFGALVGSSLIVGCGKQATNSHPQAPLSQQEAGVIAQFEDGKQAQAVCSNPGVSCREIHKPSGLYEVFGASSEKILDEAPTAELRPNRYYENLVNRTKPTLGALYDLPVFLKECATGPNPPKPVIDVLAPAPDLKNKLVELGTRIQASSTKSTHPSGDPQMQFMWVVITPEMSMGGDPKEIYGTNLDLVPDLPGGYTLMLFAKDSKKICSRTTLEFGVTINKPFVGPKAPRPFNASDAQLFKHLPMIQAREALSVGDGSGMVIAVVDTGVNYNHPDLRQNTWVNPKEIPGNGKDDDNNGRVDDQLGWDFVSNDQFPTDDDLHGTHVAGLAASGVSGVAPKSRIMAVKALNAMGGGDLASIMGSILYAADNGANIINLSLGGYMSEEAAKDLKPAIDYAEKKGALVIAAAGNGDDAGVSVDTDKTHNYPSCFSNDGLLSVASVGLTGELASYSNFGLTSVDLAAPGGSPQDGGVFAAFYMPEKKLYVAEMGTSMATPVTAGAAALVWSANHSLRPVDVKAILMKTVTAKPGLQGKMVVGGVIDVLRAAQAAKTP